MISNSQGVSNGDSMSAANGHSTGHVDPVDVRDSLTPGLFRFMAAVQVR